MRKWIVGAVLAALAGAATAGDPVETVPDVKGALGAFEKEAAGAESAYRTAAREALAVFTSRLVDGERSALRARRLDDANRIRELADRFDALAAETGKRFRLGGLLPRPEEPTEGLGIGDAVAACREELGAAEAAYRERLEAAKAEARERTASALSLAFRTADLDAANRAKDVEAAVESDVEERLRRLSWLVYRFPSMEEVEERFVVEAPHGWRVVDGELLGSAVGGAMSTAKPAFDAVSSVTIRGRIVTPARTNFRVALGPLHAILNWELAAQCHFRWYTHRTVVGGHLLRPGREHDIGLRQLTKHSAEFLIDGKRVWLTHGRLRGALSFHPALESTIGVREIRTLGIPGEESPEGPSHRTW